MASFAYDDDDDSSYKEGSIDIHDILDSDDDDEEQTPARRARKYTSTSLENEPNSMLHKKKSSTKKKRRPKPPDHPRRPLSAYNIFFQEQRSLIIGAPGATISEDGQNALNPNGGEARPSFERKKRAHRRTHGKISFSDLAKRIGQMWNSLDANDRRRFEVGAAKEKARYKEELQVYQSKKKSTGKVPAGGGNESDTDLSITGQRPKQHSIKGNKRSPVSTITKLNPSSSIPNQSRNVTLLSSFSHSFLDDECWSVSNSSTSNRYLIHPSRSESDNMFRNHEASLFHISHVDSRINQYRTTLDYEEKRQYTVKQDDRYEDTPLPVNHKSTMNVHEMVDFIKPLLVETEKRNAHSVFRPVRSHETLHERKEVYESFPYLNTVTAGTEARRSRATTATSLDPTSQQYLSSNIKGKNPRITDHEVADFLSCLLSHDQDDSHSISKEGYPQSNKVESSIKHVYTTKNHPINNAILTEHPASFYTYVNPPPRRTTQQGSVSHSPPHHDMFAI